MNLQSKLYLYLVYFLLFFISLNAYCNNENSSKDILQLQKKVLIPNVNGRISQITFDSRRQLLYIVAPENNSIEIVNLKNYSIKKQITSILEPKGISYIKETDILIITSGIDGKYFVLNASDLTILHSFSIGPKPSGIKYDSISKRIYIGFGYGSISEIEPNTFENLIEYKLEGSPEEFQFHENGNKFFVNIPSMLHFEVIDKTKKKVVSKIKINGATNNFPMAIDTKTRRLFIGCQSPAKVVIFDTETYRQLTSFDCDGDPNNIFYDPVKLRIYLSCGAGFINIFEQITGDEFKLIEKRPTRNGARTSLYIPELDLFVVAIPSSLNRPAEIVIFSINH